MCVRSHVHQSCKGLAKKIFSTKGYAEIQIQRLFFANEKGIKANIVLKIQTMRTWSLGSPTHGNFPCKKTPRSQFLVVFLISTCLLWKFCRWAVRKLDKSMGSGCHVV
jgi:hypothetical protein